MKMHNSGFLTIHDWEIRVYGSGGFPCTSHGPGIMKNCHLNTPSSREHCANAIQRGLQLNQMENKNTAATMNEKVKSL